MTIAPAVRKLVLVGHIVSSVGWLGAVVASLALGVTGLASRDAAVVRAVDLTLAPIGWYVLLPLSVASLVTGLTLSLGTGWGLLRHYWVLLKLAMNVVATGVLLLYLQTLDGLAAQAGMRDPSPIVHGGAALVLLLVATTLSVYKPRGLTGYGRRRLRLT
jgi:hypothetical protein